MHTLWNVRGETGSSATNVKMVLNRLEDSMLASHLVMNAERHDFKTEVINIACERAAAAGTSTLARENTSNSGILLVHVDAVSKGTDKGRGNESRICHNCGKAGHLMKDCWSSTGKKTGGKGKGKGTDRGNKPISGECW